MIESLDPQKPWDPSLRVLSTMDNTGGDLEHAAVEIDEKYLEGHTDQPSRDGGIDEKRHGDLKSSDSSSQDSLPIRKLDSQVVKVDDVKAGDDIYAHLPENEREIVKRQLEIPDVAVSFRTLYRYATRNDMLIVWLSAVCAIAGGAVLPLMTVSLENTLLN